MRLYLVRHPETIHNKEYKLTGWEETKYTEDGLNQFNKIVRYFRNYKEKIYSSDLKRCLDLARAIQKESGSKLEVTKLLRERNFEETQPLDHFETIEEFENRVLSFQEKYNLNEGLIISHGGVIREMIKNYLNKELDYIQKEYMEWKRDIIFEIETNKKRKIVSKIRV
ncbi:hypothetical protein CL617_04605 [archaeon]|nr:hypothetical protein [archaeon]|tara:strand:+ start:6409 stop:6912 length:504 start_codon:yes stop_codon:yes gene_type:complete